MGCHVVVTTQKYNNNLHNANQMWSWLDHDDEDEDDGVVVVVGRPAEPSKTTMAMAKRWCPVKQQPALSSR